MNTTFLNDAPLGYVDCTIDLLHDFVTRKRAPDLVRLREGFVERSYSPEKVERLLSVYSSAVDDE